MLILSKTKEPRGPLWVIKKIYQRYLLKAFSAMALGLFASLIIGLIIGQIAKIPGLSFLLPISDALGASSPVIGAAIGVAVAHGLGHKPLVMFSSAGAGAIGYIAGGPVGGFLAAVVGAEIGGLVAGRTPVDIVVTPFVTLVAGGLTGQLIGPAIAAMMNGLGEFINAATLLHPLPMGIVVSAAMGMILTLPISSAALCISLNLAGLAAGAATVGCSTQMIGFAVASFRDNGWGGFWAQGIGTSMLQMPNILRKPQIWIAPTLASAILGPLSTMVFNMENNAMGAGMGTSGLVGQLGTWAVMAPTSDPVWLIVRIALLHFILPAVSTLVIDWVLRKIGWIKDGDMVLPST
ncbi:PTS transporter subunit IIC [Gehongia tenuis]